MKKYLFFFLMLLPLVLVSCGDDDDPGSALKGTWVKTGLKDKESTGSWTFKFTNNTVTFTEKWSEPGEDDDIEVYAGTYETIEEDGKSIVTMHVTYDYGSGSDDEDWTFQYAINGKELTLTPMTDETWGYFGKAAFTLKRK